MTRIRCSVWRTLKATAFKYTMSVLSPHSAPMPIWVLVTGLAGVSASVGAYLRPLSPHKTLYNRVPSTADPAFARMYATWLLTSTTIRVGFFLAPQRGQETVVFWLAFGTYLIALWHFFLEIFVFKTAALRPGGFAPLMVASFTIAWFTAVIFGIIESS